MRLIFMGTPEFGVPTLSRLLESDAYDVVAVYSQPPRAAGRGHKLRPSPVHQLAQAHNVPVFVPDNLKSSEAQQEFWSLGADIAIVAAYGLLLPSPILEACPYGCINLHPSDLPRWRGAAPIQRTLMAGDTRTAMCIMQMEAGLDTGPVLMREPFTIPPDMTAGQLHDEMAALGADLTLQTLEQLDHLSASPQLGEPTYAAKITKAEAEIDWQQPCEQIRNLIRGLNPYPAARTTVNGENIKIFAATQAERPDGPLVFTCADGLLRLTEIQRPGKKRMSAEEALRGWEP